MSGLGIQVRCAFENVHGAIVTVEVADDRVLTLRHEGPGSQIASNC